MNPAPLWRNSQKYPAERQGSGDFLLKVPAEMDLCRPSASGEACNFKSMVSEIKSLKEKRNPPTPGGENEGFPWGGTALTALRLVLGWLFLSAFLRRVVLVPAKLDPSSHAWVGHKFNTFQPHALLIGPVLGELLLHPSALQIFLFIFTVVELTLGAALMFGLVTRLAAAGTTLVSLGILFGSGWLGTTCLDEWQLGALLTTGSAVVLLTGGGVWSLDALWQHRWPRLAARRWVRALSSGAVMNSPSSLRTAHASDDQRANEMWHDPPARRIGGVARSRAWIALGTGIAALALTMVTNQMFAGGVIGPLHNWNKKLDISLSHARLAANGTLHLTLYRTGGAGTYGAFVVKVNVAGKNGTTVERFSAQELAHLPAKQIDNEYVSKIHPGSYSLEVPLGARGQVTLIPAHTVNLTPGSYQVRVVDVSGASWVTTATVK